VLNYPITFGQPSGIGVTLYANVMVFETHLPLGSPFSVDVNYLNTARMTSAQVLDANGTVIPGATLTSAGGVTYPGIAPTIEKFPFSGFFHPVDMGGVLNGVKAGSAVPVKFSLGDPQPISSLGGKRPR
jgi:hypothetical protein